MRTMLGAATVSALLLIGLLGAPVGPVAIGAVASTALLWWRRARPGP